jgi:hypothetical protein
MKNISQVQLVTVWSQLEKCLHGTNTYSNDIAEIYASSLFTYVTCCNLPENTTFGAEAKRTQTINAEHAMCEICQLFMEMRNCLITIDALTPQEWRDENPGTWMRSHIQVIEKE